MVLCKGSAPTLATLWGVSTKGVGPSFGFADWELGIHHGRLPWTCERASTRETTCLARVLFCAAAADNLKIRSTKHVHAHFPTAKQLQPLQSPLNKHAASPSYVSAVSCTDPCLSTSFGRNSGACCGHAQQDTRLESLDYVWNFGSMSSRDGLELRGYTGVPENIGGGGYLILGSSI